MKSLLKLLAMFAFIAFMVVACSDDDDDNNTNPVAEMIKADSTLNLLTFNSNAGDTVKLFNLREGRVVSIDSLMTTAWDVGFLRTTIFVNSPNKGVGQGGAFVLRNSIFDEVAEVPADSTFYDESGTIRAIPTGSGKGWYLYDMTKSEVTPKVGVVLMIRTANGKYAKMEILSYYQGFPNNIPSDVMQRVDKCYSFRYVYQPNGTKSFKK